MIAWERMPSLIRSARIAWGIPELRPFILQWAAWKLLRFIISVPLAVLSIPLVAFSLLASALQWISETLIDPLWSPTRAITRKMRANIAACRSAIPPDEIRRRALGESTTILAKNDGAGE
ncbi:hypothetical protein D2T31_11985 [Sinirhodobacter populi]|uniref:Uncharacterized protein n=1 Tax=Paenirhodobacter populi TaxID=2306993 RepID=A0A443K7X2_9RHOB|nr:hypothetical protein [Sinirhodobacter populi]RWR28826.1 hypothetical protein D2T31_11985 [Sinirhodobacter populi]